MNKILFKLIEGKGRFFLGRNWPEEPIVPPQHVTLSEFYNQNTLHLGGDVFGYEKKLKDYKKAVQVCIDEALKNGEIVNPEVVVKGGTHGILFTLDGKQIMDGDTFDLPEGMGFEEVIGYMDDYSSGKEVCYQVKSIRLLPEKPVQKEESQEDMWMDVFKLVDTNHTIEYLSELFTIIRKES